MALVEEKYIESTDGIKKTIDKGSMGIALDILQRGLYAYPIQSTVRELASNGYDAIKEREVAKAIISGQDSIEDHFDVTKIDGVFHSSSWDSTYFDLNWLSTDPFVHIHYDEGTLKDMLRIVDNGVGLGKNRLVNYFMLNWSSKRANKDSLGRFGLGSKVALSLGVDSFRVITRYNGRRFKFDVFLDKVESIIPKFNKDGSTNTPFELVPEKKSIDDATGEEIITPAYIAYCETTTEKNGVEIQVEIKKHNKKLVFEGIESQLMYMPNIKFMHKKEGAISATEIPIAATILYRDDDVVISQSTVFNKPHILLGTGDALICYGYVSFKDLELEPKNGSVGLIMDINDIEVTPSRESPVWSVKTRAAVLAKYKKVSEKASDYLNKELSSEGDYLAWLAKAAQIIGSLRSGNTSNTTVLSRLASIIDADAITNIGYPGDTRIIFKPQLTEMMGKSLTVRHVFYDSYRKKVERKFMDDMGYLSYPIYYTENGSNPLKDRYLFEEGGKFVLINIKENAALDDKGTLVLKSKLIKDYDSVIIPQDRLDLYLADAQDIAEDDATDGKAAVRVDYSATRKVNKQIVLHTLSGEGSTNTYKFSADDVYISDLFSRYQDKLVVYTSGGDRGLLSDLMAIFPKAALNIISESRFNDYQVACAGAGLAFPDNKRLTGVAIAQENIKYIAGSSRYMSMSQFIIKSYDKKTGTVVFSDWIKHAVTSSALYYFMLEKIDYHVSRYLNSKHIVEIDHKLFSLANLAMTHSTNAGVGGAPLDVFQCSMKNAQGTHIVGFLKACAMLQLYKSGLVEASDDVIEETLNSINKYLPDYLCDDVDEILDVDVLCVDYLKDSIDTFSYYSKDVGILKLYSSIPNYDTSTISRTAQSVIDAYKRLNNIPV